MRRTDPLPGRLLIHPFTVTVRVTTSILVRLGTFGIGNFGANVTLGESGPPCLFLCPRVSLVAHRWRVLRAVAALAHGNDNTFRVEFTDRLSTRF